MANGPGAGNGESNPIGVSHLEWQARTELAAA